MTNKFIFCLEAVPDTEKQPVTETMKNLELLAFEHGIGSIYKQCDSIEGMVDSLSALLYDDHNFKNYEIIYLVMPGEAKSICLDGYFYSMEEIAELFEGKMKGKVIHFANFKPVDLSGEESQYFLDVTRAKAVSGYGEVYNNVTSSNLDRVFFTLFEEDDDVTEIVETLHQKYYALCRLLNFRLYY